MHVRLEHRIINLPSPVAYYMTRTQVSVFSWHRKSCWQVSMTHTIRQAILYSNSICGIQRQYLSVLCHRQHLEIIHWISEWIWAPGDRWWHLGWCYEFRKVWVLSMECDNSTKGMISPVSEDGLRDISLFNSQQYFTYFACRPILSLKKYGHYLIQERGGIGLTHSR